MRKGKNRKSYRRKYTDEEVAVLRQVAKKRKENKMLWGCSIIPALCILCAFLSIGAIFINKSDKQMTAVEGQFESMHYSPGMRYISSKYTIRIKNSNEKYIIDSVYFRAFDEKTFEKNVKAGTPIILTVSNHKSLTGNTLVHAISDSSTIFMSLENSRKADDKNNQVGFYMALGWFGIAFVFILLIIAFAISLKKRHHKNPV